MKDWYKYELGNEQRRDTIAKYLKRSKATFEIEDRSAAERCDWWRIKVLITSTDQLADINHFITTH